MVYSLNHSSQKAMILALFTVLLAGFAHEGLVLVATSATGDVNSQKTNSGQKTADDTAPYGHLKPFGSHRPPEGSIDSLDGLPEPEIFYEKYIKGSKPVLFKGAARAIPAFELWTDRYLAEKYGSLMIDIEEGKKENRSQGLHTITLKQFVASYHTDNIYMVQDVMDDMKSELGLPKCLWCGGAQNYLELAVIWFSSGGTKSVLHYDSVDNINCLFDGEKYIQFVDRKQEKRVEAYGFVQEGSYSKIDVEAVDLLQFPNFKHVPWWSGKMEKGDCLYIPYKWYHTVDSSQSRNLAVNLWFVHLLWFNKTDCDVARQKTPQVPEQDSLSHYQFAIDNGMGGSMEKIRSDIFEVFEGQLGVTLEDAVTAWRDYAEEADLQAIFESIDTDRDMILSWEEIYAVDLVTLLSDFPYILSDISPEEVEEWRNIQGQDYQAHDEL